MITANLRGKAALLPYPDSDVSFFENVPDTLPFASFQKVGVDAVLTDTGQLSARVKYVLRGDNELLLRVAFHQTAKEKWKDVAGLLAISDGFRGQVTSVNVSDPMETKDPFIVEYEITQTKFVDWLKKPVRIPALLPQIGLPDPPAKSAAGEAARKIELGTPLDVETQMTLKLPTGTTAQTPAGTSVERDYAKFSSKYSHSGKHGNGFAASEFSVAGDTGRSSDGLQRVCARRAKRPGAEYHAIAGGGRQREAGESHAETVADDQRSDISDREAGLRQAPLVGKTARGETALPMRSFGPQTARPSG